MFKKIGAIAFLSIFLTLSFAQNSEANLGQASGTLDFNLEPGESQTVLWGMLNYGEETINVVLDIKGEGSELVSFPSSVELPPDSLTEVEITVTVPEDHPNEVYYSTTLTAIQQSEEEDRFHVRRFLLIIFYHLLG